jgi:hypothetical protein
MKSRGHAIRVESGRRREKGKKIREKEKDCAENMQILEENPGKVKLIFWRLYFFSERGGWL